MNYFAIPGVPRQDLKKLPAILVADKLWKIIALRSGIKAEMFKSKLNFNGGAIKRRQRLKVYYRKMFYYIMRVYTDSKFIWLAGYMEQDHTTVIYAVQSFKDFIEIGETAPTEESISVEKDCMEVVEILRGSFK